MTTLPLRWTWTLVGTLAVDSCWCAGWRAAGAGVELSARARSAFNLTSLSASSREIKMSRSVPPGVGAVLWMEEEEDPAAAVVVVCRGV